MWRQGKRPPPPSWARRGRRTKRRADGFLTLSAPGPAPAGDDVGDPVFNEPSSLLGVPALTLPLLAAAGLPLGVQLLGFKDRDHELTGHARWLTAHALGAE